MGVLVTCLLGICFLASYREPYPACPLCTLGQEHCLNSNMFSPLVAEKTQIFCVPFPEDLQAVTSARLSEDEEEPIKWPKQEIVLELRKVSNKMQNQTKQLSWVGSSEWEHWSPRTVHGAGQTSSGTHSIEGAPCIENSVFCAELQHCHKDWKETIYSFNTVIQNSESRRSLEGGSFDDLEQKLHFLALQAWKESLQKVDLIACRELLKQRSVTEM